VNDVLHRANEAWWAVHAEITIVLMWAEVERSIKVQTRGGRRLLLRIEIYLLTRMNWCYRESVIL
jgi:hypothetical protein